MKCKITDCEAKSNRKEMCQKHYLRMWRNGTTEILREYSLYIKDNISGELKRKCSKCVNILDLSFFDRKKDGHQSMCKKCRSLFETQDLIKKKISNKNWILRNRDRVKSSNKNRYLKIEVPLREKLRDEFLEAYGKKCTCCEENDKMFLTIEHLKGDGKQHRKEAYGTINQYKDIKRQGYPKDKYTILCYNCNLGKSRNKGICPHKIIK